LFTLLAPLAEPFFWLLMVFMAAALFLSAQRPLDYSVAIGREDGRGSDLPFVYGWNTAEQAGGRAFRWTAEDSRVQLGGLPGGPLLVTLQVLGADAHPAVATGQFVLGTPDRRFATLPMSHHVLHVILPPLSGGGLDLQLHAPTWEPPNGSRYAGGGPRGGSRWALRASSACCCS
jgi:hypothetical protein